MQAFQKSNYKSKGLCMHLIKYIEIICANKYKKNKVLTCLFNSFRCKSNNFFLKQNN